MLTKKETKKKSQKTMDWRTC